MFLKHAIFFQANYTFEKFKHDMAAEMVVFMSDLRIVRACRQYKLNLFEIAQVMAWETAKVKANINKVGIKNVNAFADGNSWASKQDLLVFSIGDLVPYFDALGLEEQDWSSPWLEKQNAKVQKAG